MEKIALKMDKQNRVVLPSKLVKTLNLQPGSTMMASIEEDGALRLETFEVRLRRVQEMARPYFKDYQGSIVDDVIAYTHEQAALEEAKADAWWADSK